MSNSNPQAAQPQMVYQADPEVIKIMQDMKSKVTELCQHCMHRPVRIQMVEGQQVEGIVVHLDTQYIYLKVEMDPATMRQPYNPYYNPYNSSVILPLVLYNLLAITLLL